MRTERTNLVLNTWILPLKIAKTSRKNVPALMDSINLHMVVGIFRLLPADGYSIVRTCWTDV